MLTDYDGIDIRFEQMIFHNETELRTVFILQKDKENPTYEEVDLSLAPVDSQGVKSKSFTF